MSENPPQRHPAPSYRLYVDESGDHTYKKLENPWHKHLGLLGVWFKLEGDYGEFCEGLARLKRDIFGIDPDETLVLHRTEIKGRKGPFGCLQDEALDQRFCSSLIALVESSKFKMASATIDKAAHKVKYAQPIHPYHFAMTALVERYGFWLNENRQRGDAMVESRGRTEDGQLEAVYRKVATVGTFYLKAGGAQKAFTSKSLKVRPKTDDIAGLQLADLLAHPIKMQGLVERGHCEPRGGFARELAAAARPKYRDYHGGVVTGRGRVFL